MASQGKIEGAVVNLRTISEIDKKSLKYSIVLIYEISLASLEELQFYPPAGLIVEKLTSDSKWQKFLIETPFPTIAGIRNITSYFDTGDILILDSTNIVVVGKMIDEKFYW